MQKRRLKSLLAGSILSFAMLMAPICSLGALAADTIDGDRAAAVETTAAETTYKLIETVTEPAPDKKIAGKPGEVVNEPAPDKKISDSSVNDGESDPGWFGDLVKTFNKCFIEKNRYQLLLSGILVTIQVSLLAVVLGTAIGCIVALCNLSKNKFLHFLATLYTDIIRGTPSVTQLMIIYFVVFASIHIDKWIIAAIAFGINSGAYVSEIIRAGILSVDKGQTEAGRSLGLNATQTMVRIVMPQAVKNIFPALCNEFIVLVKETAIVGYVGLMDIQKAGDFIKSATFEAFMPLFATAIIYYVMIKIMTLLLGLLEKKLRKSEVR